jgi:hypothetical protein
VHRDAPAYVFQQELARSPATEFESLTRERRNDKKGLDRVVTITAWENEENIQQLVRGGSHKEAMGALFGPVSVAGGMTSVWTPARITRCGSAVRLMNVW